jgi:hypothetical protein
MKSDRLEKKTNRRRFKIKNVFRIIFDINANRKNQQHDELARQKLVNERRDHEFEKHEKTLSRNSMNRSRIRQRIVVEVQEC